MSGQGRAKGAAEGAGSPSRRSCGAAGRRGGSPSPRAGRHGGHPGPRGPARLPDLERAWWELPASPPWQWGISGCPKLLWGPWRPEGPGLPPAADQPCPRPPVRRGAPAGPGRGWVSGPQQPPARPGCRHWGRAGGARPFHGRG